MINEKNLEELTLENFKLLKVTIQATKLAKDKKKGNTGSNNIANNKLVKI